MEEREISIEQAAKKVVAHLKELQQRQRNYITTQDAIVKHLKETKQFMTRMAILDKFFSDTSDFRMFKFMQHLNDRDEIGSIYTGRHVYYYHKDYKDELQELIEKEEVKE